MARSKSIASYPGEYLHMVQLVMEGKMRREVRIQGFPTAATARGKRLEWYGFRGALNAERHPLAQHAGSIRCYVEKEANGEYSIVFCPIDCTEFSLALRGALEAIGAEGFHGEAAASSPADTKPPEAQKSLREVLQATGYAIAGPQKPQND